MSGPEISVIFYVWFVMLALFGFIKLVKETYCNTSTRYYERHNNLQEHTDPRSQSELSLLPTIHAHGGNPLGKGSVMESPSC